MIRSQENLQELIADGVEATLKNLGRDLDKQAKGTVNPSAHQSAQAKQQHMDSMVLKLEKLITVNKSILDAILNQTPAQQARLMKVYLDDLPIARIIETVLKSHVYPGYRNLELSFFSDVNANQIISAGIQDLPWSKVERLNGPIVTHLSMLLGADIYTSDIKRDFADLAEKYILNMSNSRNLYGVDLIRLFQLIEQLQANEYLSQDGSQYDLLMMNVCSNLQTLSMDLLYDASENKAGEPKRNEEYHDELSSDLNFKRENDERFEREREAKLMIFDMYRKVFDRNPDLFRNHQEYSLSPLSNLIAELFEEFSPQDALKSL